jgi:hypothetical protein
LALIIGHDHGLLPCTTPPVTALSFLESQPRHSSPASRVARLPDCGPILVLSNTASPWFKQPDVAKDEYAHVIMVSHEMRTGQHGTTGG